MSYSSFNEDSKYGKTPVLELRLKVYSLTCEPEMCSEVKKILNYHILKGNKLKSIREEFSGKRKLLLRYLSELPEGTSVDDIEEVSKEYVNREAALRESLHQSIDMLTSNQQQNTSAKYLVNFLKDSQLSEEVIHYDFRNWPLNKLLARVVPEAVAWPSSFEMIGNIIHLNLREDLYPYRFLIGEVLLAKHFPRVKTVVNKIGETSGQFRTFSMEILSGDKHMITEVKENRCIFSLDYEKVYWNSKLEAERRRLISNFGREDIVADAFAGVGPFVIQAAKERGCVAYGNDLNPISFEFLKKNIQRNHVPHLVQASCLDACTFIRKLVEENVFFTRLIMNYPSGAANFLHVLRGLYKGKTGFALPVVYCYVFGRGPDPERDALNAVLQGLYGITVENGSSENFRVRFVRDVAPEKFHMLVEFQLPLEVALSED
eukprot:jgi/Galph1/833/GphlegSOOS_G5539.1